MTDHPEHGLDLQDNTEVHDRVKALTASLLNNPGFDKEELDA